MSNKTQGRRPKKRGAQKGNGNAKKLPSEKSLVRKMLNFSVTEWEMIDKHLADIDMKWTDWAKAALLEAREDEALTD